METKFKHKKSLGQNFLHNKSILEFIAKSAEIKNNETILEIGPGEGALTNYLLDEVLQKINTNLLCIEKDHRLIDVLNTKFGTGIENKKIEIINQDILKWDIEKDFTHLYKYKLIANIPYYITGAIIEKFLSTKNKPENIIIMVQKEVAQRITKTDGKWSILSLCTKLYGESKILKIVGAGNFNPPPKIDSAILEIKLYIDLLTRYNVGNREVFDFEDFEKNFLQIVKAGLANKRKMLLPNLKNNSKLTVAWDKVFENLKIDKKIRGEDLSFDKWIEIVYNINN
jgi:16S rRNA (adenine1518-N6/adenine1519-N6)-dimethyltransferase